MQPLLQTLPVLSEEVRLFRAVRCWVALLAVFLGFGAQAAAPTGISLSSSTILENNAINATVGTLSATDADGGAPASYSYSLVSGGTDNGSFNISGSGLRASASFNFETKSSYSIRVRVTDPTALTFDKDFTITVGDRVEVAPTINAQALTITENSAAASCHGTVTATDSDGDSFTFSIVDHPDTTDPEHNHEGLFTINAATGQICIINDASIAAKYLDFERSLDSDTTPKPPYQLEIRVTDRDGRSSSGVLTVNLGNVYEPPYIVQPAPISLPEHSTGDIATIDIYDPDSVGAVRPPVTFSLTGTGHQSAGIDVLAIDSVSGVVRVLRPDLFDHETHSVFNVSVRISDNKPTPSTDTKTLTLNLVDVVPKLTTASLFLVANSVEGTILGRLDVNNPDGGTRSYSVTQFTINGTPQPSPSTLFHVDDRDQLVLDQDAVKVLAGVNLDNSPELIVTLQVSNSVGDSSVGVLPLILQSFPGGSPIMLDVTQGVGAGVPGRTEGDPVQDVAVGPNSEIIAVGSVNGRGYLKVFPRGITHPRIESFEDNFIPSAVVADSQWVYVAGHTGSRGINWKARLMENQPAKVEPPVSGVSAKIYRFPLKTTDTSPRITAYPFGSYWDSVINDMALVEGRLFVCGGIRNTQIGSADAIPYTYEPIWARLDSDLNWRDGRTVSPNNPSSQSKAGFGWLDSHHRAYYSMFTTIAVAPDDGDLYLGGYNLSWHGRDGGISWGNGWLAHMKRRDDGSYGDSQDSSDASELLSNETWIADQADQDGLDVTFATFPAPRRYHSMTFIKDLVFVKGETKSTLYAFQEYRGKGLPYKNMYLHGVQKTGPGYDNETNAVQITGSNERSLTLKIARFSPSLGSDTSTASAYIQVKEPKATELKLAFDFIDIGGFPFPLPFPKVELAPSEVRGGSMTTDAEGNLYITGMIPGGLTVAFGPSSTQEALHSRDRFFVAKYNPDLVFQWVQIFGDGAYTPVKRPTVQVPQSDSVGLDFPTAPQRPPMGPLVAEWHPRWQALLVGGNFTGGQVEAHLGNEVNWVTAPAGGAKGGFLTLLSGNNSFVKSQGLVIQSIAETDGRLVGNDQLIRPYLGGAAPAAGDTITVEVPKYIYAERDSAGNEVYLGTFENPPSEEVIRSRAVSRYVNLGITVGNREFHSDSTSYSFVFQEGTTITINWRPEHAVTIDNDLMGTGATLANGLWIRAAGGLGLTSTAAGLPDPVADKHWIKENELFTAFINGFEGDPSVFGTRYAVLGYDALGNARTDNGSTSLAAVPQSVVFDEIENRHQVAPFVVRGPSTISWKWKPQHRVQISTTSSRSEQLPRIDVADTSGQDDFVGAGEAWYDRNTLLTIGARDDEGPGSTSQRLLGWLNSLGQFRSPSSAPDGRDLLTSTFVDSGRTYLGYSIAAPGLTGPTLVVWNYGDTIYHEIVTLGSSVLFSDPLFPINDIAASPGRPRPPDRIRLVEGPAGSTGADMVDWDDVSKKLFPVRPGVFFAEWDRPNSDSKIVLEIRSGFGGDRVRPESTTDLTTFGAPKRHYRHLSHPDMPPVVLDGDSADAYALLGLRYTESDGLLADGKFTAQRPGRHVVVFSQSNVADVRATGDRTTETLLVRVIETRRWNAEYSAADPKAIVKGAWSDTVGSSMLMEANPATDPAVIGRKVTSSLDTAGLQTGFVVSSLARYNVNIYDRTKVADAGPIIPVNRHFVTSIDDDLMIVWYEHAESASTVPANILWPWQSVRYATRWPEHSDLTLVKDAGGADVPQPVDRIVVASRLGSEGHNDNGVIQTFFDRERYSAVRIYEQSDRTKAGYNPNEEHALTAPSFKFLDQANPPTAAFALRNDLNVTTQNASYTSDPYVLVEYFDQEEGDAGEYKMAVYQIELEDDRLALNPYQYNSRDFPYTFNYPMKAGEPVQPPYPLGLVIGLTPCKSTSGENLSPGRVYWEDYKGQAWAVSEGRLRSYFFYPQAVNFWNGEGATAVPPGDCIRFRTDGAVMVTGQRQNPTFAVGQNFVLNGTLVTLTGPTAADFVAKVNALPSSVDARLLPTGEIRLTDLTGANIILTDGSGSPLFAAGIAAPFTYQVTTGVTYNATWPDTLPILKVGETLTFAGGEYKADNPGPEQPGLPGVVGWAAGRVVFDSRNPAMDNQQAFDQYAARLIAPLEDRFVQLTDTQAATLEEIIQPANKLTSVSGVLWKFNGLSASIGKRIFYDYLKNRLLIRGYLNDRTLGDSDLTATPPPVYVLEPDILTRPERDALLALPGLTGNSIWNQAVADLYALSRNPEALSKTTPATTPYYAGLELDVVQENNGDKFDTAGLPVTIPKTARHKSALGPGLALIASPRLLEPGDPNQTEYVTLAENDDSRVGGPVSLFIVKIEKKHRYRGAIKTILSDNVFDEKITLRHTADFGANGEDIVYQWFYREEDGQGAPLPPDPAWKLFADQSDNSPKGLGLYQITVEGTGGLILADNLFFLRYRHRDDVPTDGLNSVNWAKGSPAKPYGTEWNRDGAEFRDPEAKDLLGNADDGLKFGGQFAGAANSPTVDQIYRAQLVMGWIKRVLDRVNPYEARFSDFRNNTAPATYANMIQEAGQAYVGPVALNPDKDVIENVGLIELYQTILDRGVNLSIGLSSPITTPGINNALLLAATRISDLYTLMGNEAYADALDPTIGFVSGTGLDLSGANPGYGSMAPALFAFQNQVSSLLEEELALLRGVDDSYARPVNNRLFWNFTKGDGEVAYAMNYNIKDVNQDGFIDENDARVLYPQGHGDAWGHYLTALKTRYSLLKHPFFNWQTRSEFYNLLDVVIPVDYLDERKFAQVAAAKAQAGTEIVNLTYRSQYVDDPAGQWQGYTDPTPRREWGVTDWARRAGQGALFDWITANSLIPSKEADPLKQGIRRIDRSTVTDIAKVSANLGAVQSTYDNANGGLNPLGLESDVMPFDLDPLFPDIGSTAQIGRPPIQGTSHFEQIFERAFAAVNNARVAFDYATVRKNALRQVADNVDQFRQDVIDKDLDFRNRLIEIFGTPYEGTIGTGKPYPAGYSGPDLSLYMYVDVRDVSKESVPTPNAKYAGRISGFAKDLQNLSGDFKAVLNDTLLNDLDESLLSWTGVVYTDDSVLDLKLPATAGSYTFQAPSDWGTRDAPGRLQQITSEMVQTEADLGYAVGNYDVLINQIEHQADRIESKYGVAKETIRIKNERYNTFIGLNVAINALKIISSSTIFTADVAKNIADATSEGTPKVIGLANDVFFGGRLALTSYGATAQYILRLVSLVSGQAADVIESSKDLVSLRDEISIDKEGFTDELKNQVFALEELFINEGTLRIAVFKLKEQLRSQADQYRATLQEGIRLIQERETFNQNTAAAAQGNRYRDMAFRVSRNAAVEKYRASFDLASRYAYMAAKAYDFETNLSPNDRGSAYGLFDEIIRARSLGEIADGVPLHPGGGLAGILITLYDNFRAVESQISLNNYQIEKHAFSLRLENFGIGELPSDVDSWKAVLQSYWHDDLWENPEFRRYCRPPAARDPAVPEPGLIIPFSSEIRAGHNFFGQPLIAGQGGYDPSNFATKIRSANVLFKDYDSSVMSTTPRAYLIPVGLDVMYIPTSPTLETREWNVVDQAIPVPFKTGLSDLASPNWIAAVDSLQGTYGQIRRYSSHLVHPTSDTEEVDLDSTWRDMRLVGRSVWNTQWLLVIPGRSLLADGEAGLNELINSVTDIQIAFETYASSGN